MHTLLLNMMWFLSSKNIFLNSFMEAILRPAHYQIIAYCINDTHKGWIKSWTIYANTWIRILVSWRVGCSVDSSTWQSRIARKCQTCRIILTWANRLSGYRIIHDRSTIFAASRCWTRCTAICSSHATRSSVRWSICGSILRCLRKGTGRKWAWLSASIWTQWRRWICLR